ncbi:MAG: sugar phosphate nucleotidyltransferase, partial [Verrucomicrobiota bacterium]
MMRFERYLIRSTATIREALPVLDELASNAILFVVSDDNRLLGSLTDGDVRRGLIQNLSVDSPILDFVQPNPKFIEKGRYDLEYIVRLRDRNITILPVVDRRQRVVNVINLRTLRSYLPVDAVIMAGGRGERLKPLTDKVPKPLLHVGDKPIIEHNLDRLISYGIDDFWITIRYLGDQIRAHLGDGDAKNVRISYVTEDKPLGTIGAITLAHGWHHDHILLTNSDLLTNLDYESFYLDFIKKDADLSVVSIPYKVDVPYAVLETSEGLIHSFKEKPTYT